MLGRVYNKKLFHSYGNGPMSSYYIRLLVGNLLECPVGDHAAPVIWILDLIHLQADTRVNAQRVQFFARQRVDVNVLSVEVIIHRHDVRPTCGDTTEPPQGSFA